MDPGKVPAHAFSMVLMWLDERGSEILTRGECIRLLTSSAGSVGHLGMIIDGRPIVLPINFGIAEGALIVQIGSGTTCDHLRRQPIVAFEVDHGPDDQLTAWSVLIQGPAEVVDDPAVTGQHHYWGPHPVVPEPGSSHFRIRPWWVTGRRFHATSALQTRDRAA